MPILTQRRALTLSVAPSVAAAMLSTTPALLAAPAPRPAAKAASKPVARPAAQAPSLSGWSVGKGEELEGSWAWRARLKGQRGASGEARVTFGALDGKGDSFLRVWQRGKVATLQFWRESGGRLQAASALATISAGNGLDGELGMQALSSQMRVLWNGRVVLEAWGIPTGGSIAAAAKGMALSGERLQPTEEIAFSDDFMRATGPNEPEVDGSWHRVTGVWKTSGLLGPRADAALNPNPFVFRAEAPAGAKEAHVLATVGSWFWSDYAVTASVKPMLLNAASALVVGLGAYMGDKEHARSGISAQVDVRSGRASLVRGTQVLAQSAPFDFDPNTWHRLYFEPGPNTIRLVVDGVERVRLDSATARAAGASGASGGSGASALGDASQGQAALVARLAGANYADFDDVRAASSPTQSDSFRVASPGRWADASGEWQTVAGARGGQRVLRTPAGLTLTGAPEREEGSVEASFDVSERVDTGRASASKIALSGGADAAGAASTSTWAGVAFAAQDARNYFAARARGSHLEIVQVADGKARLLGSGALPPAGRPLGETMSTRQNISVQWRDGIITARASGTVVSATVASIPAGRVGAVAKQGTGSRVALTSLQALGASPAWGEGTLPEKFTNDRLMKNWASNAAAWKRGSDGGFWHTGDFFGDSALTMPLPKMPTGSRLALRLSADPERSASGAKLEVEKLASGWKLSLSQDGKYLGGSVVSESDWAQVEQAGDPDDAKGAKKMVRVVRFVRRPLGEGRVSLRAVAGAKTVFAQEVAARADALAIKCGVSLGGAGGASGGARGSEIPVRLVTVARDGHAVVGVQLAELTEDAQRESGLADSRGAVIQGIEAGTPAVAAGLKTNDVIRAIDGKKVASLDDVISTIGGKAAGASVALTIWRPSKDSGPLDLSKATATTTQALDYTFTGAPVDWEASAGKWAVAERWICRPDFAFFNGSNASNPTLWSRFEASGDWTLEAYLASSMDQTRGERSPSDLNLTIGGDGRDLSSGYSWVFGGVGRSVNRVYRGDAIALEKPFEAPSGLGNTHQDWFYVRLEKRQTPAGLRFRYFVNNKMLMEYSDPAPLKAALAGGRFAFWTYNGGMSIARARLWYSKVETANVSAARPIKGAGASVMAASTWGSKPASPIANPIGAWAGRREDVLRTTALVSSEKDGARNAVKITNAQSGGDWTTYASRQPFDAAQKPVLSFDYRAPAEVKVNLYVKVEDRWREILFTDSVAAMALPKVRARLVPNAVRQRMMEEGNAVDTSVRIGAIEGVQADGKWHHASIDLAAALRKANLGTKVQEVALAAPDRGYLRCGLGGNHLGATYWIANFNAGASGTAPGAVALAPRE